MPDAAAKYRDSSEEPLSNKERASIYRNTSDPLSFHENFIHWLNVKYIDEFKPPPHGAQLEMIADYTNPGASEAVVEWGTVNHDTNSYILGDTFRVPGIPTVKLSGVYTMSVTFSFDDPGSDPTAGIYINDRPVAYDTIAENEVTLCVVRRLNEGDIVDVRVSNSGGTQTILAESGLVKAVFNIALLYLLDNGPINGDGGGEMCNPPVNTIAPEVTVTQDE